MNDKVSPSTEATEQQDAEPVAWMIEFSNRMGEPSRAVHLHNAVGDYREQFDSEAKATPLYAAPQAEEKHSHRGDDEPALAAPEAGKELEQYTGSAPAPKGWPTEAELTVDERGKTALKFVREAGGITALLDALDTALTDWVRTYAPEHCYPDYVAESVKRIADGGGTLAYIADLRMRVRKEQTMPAPEAGKEPARTARFIIDRPGEYFISLYHGGRFELRREQ